MNYGHILIKIFCFYFLVFQQTKLKRAGMFIFYILFAVNVYFISSYDIVFMVLALVLVNDNNSW